MKQLYQPLLIFVSLCTILLIGCEKNTPQETDNVEISQPILDDLSENQQTAATNNSLLIEKSRGALAYFQQQQQLLFQAIKQFTQHSNTEHWQKLQEQWQKTHNSWHRLDYFLGSVALYPSLPSSMNQIIENIHSSPITAGYIDSITGYPHSGLVNDLTVTINSTTIRDHHQTFERSESAIGLHVLEFFLMEKQKEDFIIDKKLIKKSEHTHTAEILTAPVRRNSYLNAIAVTLQEDSLNLQQQWPHWEQQIAALAPELQKTLALDCMLLQLVKITRHNANAGLNQQWQKAVLNQQRSLVSSGLISAFNNKEKNTIEQLLTKLLKDVDKPLSTEGLNTLIKELRTIRSRLAPG